MTKEKQNTSDFTCPYLEQCDLVVNNKARMPNLIQRIQSYYCNKLTSQCSRRWIYDTLGKQYLPPLLLPNQWEWAREIICEYGEKDMLNTPPKMCDKIQNEES